MTTRFRALILILLMVFAIIFYLLGIEHAKIADHDSGGFSGAAALLVSFIEELPKHYDL